MRFIHTGDLHFGANRRLNGALKRQKAGANAPFKIGMKNKVRVIVIAGDLFDNKETKPEERDAILKLLLHYDALGYIILVIGGNHDQASATYTNLRYLRTLYEHKKFQHLRIAICETGPEFVEAEGQEFLLFPGFYDGDVNIRIEELCKDRKRKPVVVMHEVVKGALADNGFPLEVGIKLDKSLPVRYFAMGDLHECQQLKKIPHAWYCGSPIQHDFGEKVKKGVLLVDTDHPDKPKFMPIDLHPKFLTVKEYKKALELKEDWIRLVLDHAPEDELPEHIIDFEYTRKKVEVNGQEQEETEVIDRDASPIASLKKFLKDKTNLRKKSIRRALEMAEKFYGRALRVAKEDK